MIDHLLRFADEAAAQAALSLFWAGSWRMDVCNPGVSVFAVMGVEALTDPQTGQTWDDEVREYFPGWFMTIGLPALDPALRDLPDHACRLIADRDAHAEGRPFLLYVAPDLTPEVMAAARIEPMPAGSNYPFGV